MSFGIKEDSYAEEEGTWGIQKRVAQSLTFLALSAQASFSCGVFQDLRIYYRLGDTTASDFGVDGWSGVM